MYNDQETAAPKGTHLVTQVLVWSGMVVRVGWGRGWGAGLLSGASVVAGNPDCPKKGITVGGPTMPPSACGSFRPCEEGATTGLFVALCKQMTETGEV